MKMNSLLGGGLGTFCGVQVIQDDELMSDWIEDWSGCRSIPRAKRRHARGIKTRMVLRKVPKKYAYFMNNGRTMIVHSQVRRLIEEETKKDLEQIESEAFLRKNKPQPNPDSPWRSSLSWSYGAGLLRSPSIIDPNPNGTS